MSKKLCFTCLIIFNCSIVISAQISLDDIIKRYDEFNEELSIKNKNTWPIKTDNDIKEKSHFLKSLKKELSKIEADSDNPNSQINIEMLDFILGNDIYNLDFGSHMMPLNSEGGFITSMLGNVRGKNLKNQKDIDNYIEKLGTTLFYLDNQIEWLNKGIESGKVRPKLVVNNCLELLEDILKEETFFLFKPLEGKHKFDPHYENAIYNGFKRLHKYLTKTYLPAAPDKIGIREIKNGKTYYEQRVKYYTTLDMSPQEIFDLGHQEVKRIRSQMDQIIKDLKYDGGFKDFTYFLRTDEQFYAKSDKEILYYASWLSKKAEEILPRYFNKLPRLPFTVTPVPLEIAPNYTTGRYSGGSMEDQKAGQYWVNTTKLPSRPLYVLPSLTLHEAVPGHHLQISLAKELTDLPKFRSYYLSAFGEGWGLYSEFLGKEAGIYTTPYQDFGRLTYEMWRACRLVVDPGMHYFGMTRDEAVTFMTENTALSIHEVNTEINRYIGWPGQAVSYKIGELKIRELRKQAEEELGDTFDIKSFHDVVLANGSIPLNTLERIINEYIKVKKKDVEKN
jgi:uncharacterized protein (DUF885 family)